jgi:hypothetical protein
MMMADEIRALLLIHDRLNAWERPFIRDMAKLLEQRRSPTTKQLATISRILDRHRVWTVLAQAAPDQLTLLAEPVTRVVEALQPTRVVQPARAKTRARRKQHCAARGGRRGIDVDAVAPLVDDPLPW